MKDKIERKMNNFMFLVRVKVYNQVGDEVRIQAWRQVKNQVVDQVWAYIYLGIENDQH